MEPKQQVSLSAYFLFIFGFGIIVSGISFIYFGPVLLKYIIKENLVLTPSSRVFKLWEKPPFNLSMDFYFFNWTNSEDVYNTTVKPKFEQVGPYKFTENQKKVDIVWNSNGTVTFKRLKIWRKVDEADAGNLQDNITTINPLALATAHVSRTWNYVVRKGVSIALSRIAPTIKMTHTVSQLLFEGYPDTLLTIVKTFPFFADQDLPNWNRFGWFYGRNASSFLDGTFTVGTGKNSSFGSLYKWNYLAKTPNFENKCGEVGNSYLDVFEPCENKASISIFSSETCRKVPLEFAGKTRVDGIIGNKYIAGDRMFDNGTLYPENKCYCGGDCLPAGVFNTSSCRWGTPTFVSLPHFSKADPYFNNLIEGLKPDPKNHKFFVVLEPTTGIPLEIVVRLQLNLLLQPVPGISMYEKAPRVLFPVIWFDQKMKLPAEHIYMLKLLLSVPLICSIVGIITTISSLLLFVYAFYKYFGVSIFKKKTDNFLYQHETIPLKE